MTCSRCVLLLCSLLIPHGSWAAERWFEEFKREASAEQLYRFLYALPKGGDLHNHLSGAVRPEWLLDAALAQASQGYRYFTKVRIDNCLPYGSNEYGQAPYLLLFVTLQESSYRALDDCQQGEFKPLDQLSASERTAWLDSLRLDAAHEGRNEFFGAHWQRMRDLTANPQLWAELIVRNMQAFGAEGVVYLELQHGAFGHLRADGSEFPADEVAALIQRRLAQPDARATGVQVRLQSAILRFAPNAEQHLRSLYAFTDRHRDLYVGINMVGREDDDKGHPLRFLSTLRELRRHYPEIHLAIHGGEVDEPNQHVRDTLLLGAERIGHGVNLISDPDTLLLMRKGPYLVEINLISNLLLEYVADFQQHPFPEYLRIGVPVALSTDDRGMWDSNLTDEYYVAVREFNLSWEELVLLGRNSLQYGFMDDALKQRLLHDYDQRVARFAERFRKQGLASLPQTAPVSYGFTCRHYQICR